MNVEHVLNHKRFDLHIHTTASDGAFSPTEIVKKALEANLEAISITDHDTIDGIKEAEEEAEKYGIIVIPGVELSTKYKNTSVDILGYGLMDTHYLLPVLEEAKLERETRAFRIIDKFNSIGMNLTIEDVLKFSGKGVIARPHIAKAVVDKGYVDSYQKVFDDYLADGKPCCLDKKIITPDEAIHLIHQTGGIASLAHPVLLQNDELVKELLDVFPFDAIEVWHRKQNPDDNARYARFAKEFGLLSTGGSDFHFPEHTLGDFQNKNA